MKFVAFFVLFVVAASKKIQFDRKLNEHWENFKKEFGKNYNVSEEITRRSIWEKRVAGIKRHNLRYDLGLQSYRMGINEYSDMDHEEFVRSFNGYRQQSSPKINASIWVPDVNARLPDHVDWRENGLVTPVKNQKGCSSCWAFAATGALEGQHTRKTGKLVSLSEQNLVDCSEPWGNHGCSGGYIFDAYNYVLDNRGIDTEASYPYTAVKGDCKFKRNSVGAKAKGFRKVAEDDERVLKAAVALIGPISVGIDASHQSLSDYKGGVYDEPLCKSVDLDHAVLVVGYGTEDGKDYWLVKNSYGPTWGDKGYVKMSRNKNNQCGIASRATFPLV